MGTFLRIGPYRIEIRTREHGVPHFHVVGPNGKASVSIKEFRILATSGVNERDLRRICKVLAEHQETMMEVWHENQKD
jgi:hypothetical protein